MQAEKIVSIKRVGIMPTVDIEVKSDKHIYYQNGVVGSNSHGISYATISLITAYIKSHFTQSFFTNWLKFSFMKMKKKGKEPEGALLVQDAKLFGIKILIPDLSKMRKGTHFDGPNIRFGINDINGVGDSQIDKLFELIKSGNKDVSTYTWPDFMLSIGQKINSKSLEALIGSGALSCFGVTRRRMMNEYASLKRLKTKKTVLTWLEQNKNLKSDYRNLLVEACKLKKEGGPCATEKTKDDLIDEISILDNPPSLEDDTVTNIVEMENKYLDISLSYGKLDGCDTSGVTAYCKEIAEGRKDKCKIGVVIKSCRPFRTKTGKLMTYLTVSDETDTLGDICCFPDEFKDFISILREGNTLLLEIEPARKGRDGFILVGCWQI